MPTPPKHFLEEVYGVDTVGEVIIPPSLAPLPEHDPVDNPKHYTQGGIQPLDFIMAHNMSFCQGNVIKYVTRYKWKDGVTDLKKARCYLDKLIQVEQEKDEEECG